MSRGNWALLLILSVLWATAFLVVERLLAYLPPLTLVLLRVCFGAPVIALALRAMGIPLPQGRQWRQLAVLGLINAALPFAMLTTAQTEISGALTAILNATMPIAVLLALRLLLGQRLGVYRVIGVVTGLLGVAVMMQGAGSGTMRAILLCLGATSCYALGQIWSLRLGTAGIHPMQAAFGQIFWAAVFLLPAAMVFERPWTLAMPPPGVWAAVIALAVFSTALGYIIFFRVLGSAGALASSLVTLILPVAAVALSSVLTRSLPEPKHLAGMALILSGLGLIELARRRDVKRSAAQP